MAGSGRSSGFGSYMLLVGVLHVGSKRLELAKMLPLIHDRRTDMFNECGSDILGNQTLVSGHCAMQIL